jgi:hypothetical protein
MTTSFIKKYKKTERAKINDPKMKYKFPGLDSKN